jgi:hypothetical protein
LVCPEDSTLKYLVVLRTGLELQIEDRLMHRSA